MINIIIALLLGIVSGDLWIVLLFLCIYIPLRSFCGGWHADKIWKCIILSNLIILGMVIIDEYYIDNFSIIFMVMTFILCLPIVLAVAPIDTKAKSITFKEKRIYKSKIRIIVAIHVVFEIVMMMLKIKTMLYVFSVTYITQVIMLVLEIIDKKIIQKTFHQ